MDTLLPQCDESCHQTVKCMPHAQGKLLFEHLNFTEYQKNQNNIGFITFNAKQNDNGTPTRNFYSQYGEAEILLPAMCDVVQTAFKAAFIDYAKGHPSAIGIHQSWDRETYFRDTETSNPTLALHIRRRLFQTQLFSQIFTDFVELALPRR